MGEYVFKMPDIGEGVTEAEIVSWHVKPGETVEQDAPICDAMTDKATVELTAPVSGVIKSVGCGDGEIMAIGAPLVVFEVEGDSAQTPPKPAKKPVKTSAPKKPQARTDQAKEPEPKPEAKPAPVATPRSAPAQPAFAPVTGRPLHKPLASPAVRKRAGQMGIDLALVPASGKAGQVTHADLDAFAKGGTGGARQKRTGVVEKKVTGLRRIISERMSEAKRRIPHFSYVEQVDMSALEETRAYLNAHRRPDQPKLTVLPFFMLAMVRAVRHWPMCNATFDDEAGVVHEHAAVHIGMAAQTDKGLMVPVVRHAEALDIWGLASEIARLAEAAKTGTIRSEELSGSTISLTSLGRLAGVVATPVINRPEVAILCPNRIMETPVVRDGAVVVRKIMNFSSSFDHRVVDGFHAAEMMNYIKGLLEHPATLFMDDV